MLQSNFKKNSSYLSADIYYLAGIIGAHSAAPLGFRQRDVRFYLELVLNWVSGPFSEEVILHNTQILRFISFLEKEGYLKKIKREKRIYYSLTRVGLIESVRRIAEREVYNSLNDIFFAVYFLKTYRQRLIELVSKEGSLFPPALRLELEALLDSAPLINRQKKRLSEYLRFLNSRLLDNQQSVSMSVKLLREGKELTEVAREVEKHHPYELNSQKALSRLMAELNPQMATFELTDGALARNRLLWLPIEKYYRQALKLLEALE